LRAESCPRRSTDFSIKWRSTLAVAIATLATAATIGKFSPEIHRLLELEKRVDSLAAEEQRLERDLAAAEQTHRWLQDEPAYIDAVVQGSARFASTG